MCITHYRQKVGAGETAKRGRDSGPISLFLLFGRKSVDLTPDRVPTARIWPPAAVQNPLSLFRSAGGWSASFSEDRFFAAVENWGGFSWRRGSSWEGLWELSVPACGDSITGGGAGLPGEPEGCPALVFARGFLFLVSFVSARAREDRQQTLCWCGFQRFLPVGLFLHFPGSILHFPG